MTRFVEFTNTRRAVHHGFIGYTNPNEVMEVTVHLRRKRSEAELDAFIEKVRNGTARPLTQKQFAARFGANQGDINRVCQYASASGLTVVEAHRGSRTVKLSGTVEELKKAFNTEIADVMHDNGLIYRARTSSYGVPANLSKCVVAVLGLTQIPKAKSHHRILPHDSQAQRRSYTGAQVLAGYGISLKTRGKGHVLWIGELGGGYRQKDLDDYAAKYGLPKMNIMATSVDGAKNSPSSANSADGEVMLDLDVPYSMIPEALFEVAFAPNSGRGFADLILQFAHKSKARRGSISWGMSEDSWDERELAAMTAAFKDCAAMGKTVCCSAGDDGSTDGVSDGKQHCDYPASESGDAQIAIGGTHTEIDAGVLKSESVWNNGGGRSATGGGVSRRFAKPAMQAGISILAADDQHEGHLVPDVASPADPSTGFTVYVDGQVATFGGTSAGSPWWAGLLVGIDAERVAAGKAPVAAAKAELYKRGKMFREVTQGDNGAYKAGPGFNCCTGWGTPTQALVADLVASAA